MNTLLTTTFAITTIPFFIGWLVQRKTLNATSVDALWAITTGVLGVVYATLGSGDGFVRLFIGTFYSVWAIRLGALLVQRSRHPGEDGRYAQLRIWAKGREQPVFFTMYMIQAGLAWLFALPAWAASTGEAIPIYIMALACGLFLASIIGTTIADFQLQRFKDNPANHKQVCDQGLWRYSRHPNYFFEWLHWFCYPLLGWLSPWASWLWLTPVMMVLFLYFITGIPFTEQQAIRSRGDAYRAYQSRTSPFIPWRLRS